MAARLIKNKFPLRVRNSGVRLHLCIISTRAFSVVKFIGDSGVVFSISLSSEDIDDSTGMMSDPFKTVLKLVGV